MPKKSENGGQQSLAARPESRVALPMEELARDAGAGLEEASQQDIAIPFLAILQSNSPQVKRGEGAYIDGAKAGDVLNTVTGELFEDGLEVIPCYFRREIVEWRLREKGGGFVGVHPAGTPETQAMLAECIRDAKYGSRDVRPNGETHLAVTANHYVLLGDGQMAVIAMASTQLKKSRKWNTMMTTRTMHTADGKAFTPPTYGCVYRLATVPEKNAKGSWMGWSIEHAGEVEDRALYEKAREFHALVKEGRVRPTDSPPETPEPGEDGEREGRPAA